jgi:thymidylate kinase
VVELSGLPGSGKTTVAGLTCALLLRQGVRCPVADRGVSAAAAAPARIGRRALASAREAARHPLTSTDAVRAVVASRQSSPRDTVAAVARWLAVCDLVDRCHGAGGAHLLEEGVVQRLWSLALRTETDVVPQLWAGLRRRSRTDLVVVVDVPVQLAARRLAQRASRHSRTQQLPPAMLLGELERGRDLLDRILMDAPVRVVRLDGAGAATPDRVAERVATSVMEALGSDRHHAQ